MSSSSATEAAGSAGRDADGEPLIALGWATVDLERSLADARSGRGPLAELAAALGADAVTSVEAPRDPWLGARCRVLAASGSGPRLVLLEPDTEGRLAASLARFGEGLAVRWLRGAAGAPGAGGGLRSGPFGPERLLPSARPWGPHVLTVPAPSAGAAT